MIPAVGHHAVSTGTLASVTKLLSWTTRTQNIRKEHLTNVANYQSTQHHISTWILATHLQKISLLAPLRHNRCYSYINRIHSPSHGPVCYSDNSVRQYVVISDVSFVGHSSGIVGETGEGMGSFLHAYFNSILRICYTDKKNAKSIAITPPPLPPLHTKILHYTRLSKVCSVPIIKATAMWLHSTSRTNLLDPRMRRWRPHSSHKDPMDPHMDTGLCDGTVHVSTFRIRPARINLEPSPLETGQTVFTTRHYQP